MKILKHPNRCFTGTAHVEPISKTEASALPSLSTASHQNINASCTRKVAPSSLTLARAPSHSVGVVAAFSIGPARNSTHQGSSITGPMERSIALHVMVIDDGLDVVWVINLHGKMQNLLRLTGLSQLQRRWRQSCKLCPTNGKWEGAQSLLVHGQYE